MIVTWQVLREKGKKKLPMIPHGFTLANAFFGFLAIINALHDSYMTAIGCIMIAAFMDALDGRIARMFGVTSSLGLELDSLCDAISFCLAPAIILYCSYLREVAIEGILVLALYLWCGLWRLARFNIGHASQSGYFIGLPTPVAALFLMGLLASSSWFVTTRLALIVHSNVVLTVIILVALLMISPVKFASFKRKYVSTPLEPLAAVIGFMVVVVTTLKGLPVLFLVLTGYIAHGLWQAACGAVVTHK